MPGRPRLPGYPSAAAQAENAATYGVNVPSVSNWVTTVTAAGADLPLSPEMATEDQSPLPPW